MAPSSTWPPRSTTAGDGQAVTVFNALSWSRTDIARVEVDLPDDRSRGLDLVDDAGQRVPFLVESADPREAGGPARATIAFLARDVPAVGYRTFHALPGSAPLDEAGWQAVDTLAIENETFALSVDPSRGGGIASLVDKRSGKQLIRPGEVANELRSYREYPNHPLFAEGPWHLTPDGRFTSAIDFETEVTVEVSPIGQRIRLHGPFEASRREQEIRLWTGIDRVELTTSLHDYDSHDRLFRLRFPAAVEGGAPVSETGNAVIGRPFGRPNVNVAEVPFTLDHPAYNWFALGATARIALGAPGAPVSEARAARAIGVAEVVVPDDPRQDDGVRELVIALVRQGVTSTVSRHDGHRYGVLHIDSNLPDVRLAIGRADDNRFVAAVLDGADPGYRAEFDRQLASGGRARLWVPEDGDARRRAEPITDLRGARDLPVLIVAGVDADHMAAALDALVADLEDGVIAVDQPAELDGPTGTTEDYTVAVINRGMPSFNVEADGNLYLSIMRSCSGWPSGVWIDPPRRSTPDGANFQFQHWSHTFDYAIAAAQGDWRDGGIVRAGHDFNNPLVARAFDAHPGRLPATAGFLEVEPSSVVLTVLKPGGDPQARMAGMELDPAHGIALRLYESSGRPTLATIRSRWPIAAVARTNLLEEDAEAIPGTGTTIEVRLEPYEIVTLAATLEATPEPGGGAVDLAPRGEVAQPVFSDYWLHNKGAAPMGYQSVTVQIKPSFLVGEGPFDVPIVVASERTDGASAGSGCAHRAARLGGGARRADLSPCAGRGPCIRGLRSSGPRGGPRPLFPGRADHGRGGPDARGRGDRRLPAGRRWHGPQGRRRRALGRAWLGGRSGAHDGRYRARAGHVEPGRNAARPGWRDRGRAAGSRDLGGTGRRRHAPRVALEHGRQPDPRRGPDPEPVRDVDDDPAMDPGLHGRARRPDDARVRRRAATGRRRRHVLGAGQGHVFRARALFGVGAGHDPCRERGPRPPPRGRRDLDTQRGERRTEVEMTSDIKVGALPWGQRVDWASLQHIGQRADELGYDSLWTWDHLYPIQGDWRGPIFEGYLILAGWAAVTSRATLGLMVGANTFRNPALTVKLATTPRPHEQRAGDPRHRRRLVRARARGLRDRVRVGLRRAPDLARRGGRSSCATCSATGRRRRAARAITRRASATTRRRSSHGCRS